jgi:signal transduction histidine kinase
MAADSQLELKTVIDGLGQGVLIFSADGRLVLENLAARTILGNDLNLIRNLGWEAASTLFNSRQTNPDDMIEAARDRALQSERPVRFFVFRSGEQVPCWAAAVQADNGEVCTMVTIDVPDWTAMTNILDRFRGELKEAIDSTQGHVDLITQNIEHRKADDNVDRLSKRLTGFTRLISIHMDRVSRFMEMLERMEDIRMGRLRETLRNRRSRINLRDFLEDFVEELDEIRLVDPETDAHDHRSRLTVQIDSDIAVRASTTYLTRVLHDILRNAIMYSMKAAPISIKVQVRNQHVQFDLTDQGYGIRERERDRVFEAFLRARQPQIIAEFGYGLSLYLCKHEIEAMDGRLWFESEENVGTTFSLTLPIWTEESVSTASSSPRP